MIKKIMFDVGAHLGDDSQSRRIIPWWDIHAFEPNPDISARIRPGRNYRINTVAVSDYDGMADLQVDDIHPETSSLLPITYGAKGANNTPITATRTIRVPTIRLDTYIRENGITRIDDLHIDTQGNDLAVLRSLGDCIGMVRRIKCEAMISPIYTGQSDRRSILSYLIPRGFDLIDSKMLCDNVAEDLFFIRRAA